MGSPLFDEILILDWSASGRPSPAQPSANAIWIGGAFAGPLGPAEIDPLYRRTRAEAVATLNERLSAARAAGRRVLLGCDFPFGYPVGTAMRLTGTRSALALWDWIAAHVADGPDNRHTAFETGVCINGHWSGPGPCWGHPNGRHYDGLGPRKHGISYGPPDMPAERRIIERRVPSAKSVWQLAYAGSVGAQALTGIAALSRLRQAFGRALAIWPIETGLTVPDTPLVLAEIYPSFFRKIVAAGRRPAEILDRAQVRITARELARLDTEGRLRPLFHKPTGLTESEQTAIAREEAWMLGVP